MKAFARTEPVEIVLLSEERSQQAAQILQEKGQKCKPLAMARQMVACGGAKQLREVLARRVPLLAWTRRVTRHTLYADFIAGLTVGVMVIPQSMSYANIAGLPYIYGMYAACTPAMVYAIFGQSRQLAVGPVVMVSLLINAGLEGPIQEICPGWSPGVRLVASKRCSWQVTATPC